MMALWIAWARSDERLGATVAGGSSSGIDASVGWLGVDGSRVVGGGRDDGPAS